MSGKKKGGSQAAPQQQQSSAPVVVVTALQQLIRDLLSSAAEALPKDALLAWTPAAVSAATSAIEKAVASHHSTVANGTVDEDHLKRLVIALTLAIQTSTSLNAQNSRIIVANTFSVLWDEVSKFPGDYGLAPPATSAGIAAPKSSSSPSTSSSSSASASGGSGMPEVDMYKPPAVSATDYEAWSRAFAFIKASIKPTS